MMDPMRDVNPQVVTDENGAPVAVQIPYAEWLRLEGYLTALRQTADSSDSPLEKDSAPSASSEAPPSTTDSPSEPTVDREATPSGLDDRTGVSSQLDQLLRARSSKGEKMRQRLQQEWGHLEEAPEPSPDPSADIDDDFDQALDEARGTLSEDDADYERAIREQWDQL